MSLPRNRTRAKKHSDKKYFTRNADKVHVKNFLAAPMRGGIRS